MDFFQMFAAGLISIVGCYAASAEVMNLRVTSSSMMPTFGPGDVVATTSYASTETMERGDLVAYKVHYISKSLLGGPGQLVDTVFLGRIIGLPGETIEIEDGIPIINGEPLKMTPISSTLDGGCPEETESSTYYQCRFVRETTPKGKSYILLDMVNNSFGDNIDAKTLADNEYYIMGDNRDNANDSRFPSVGLVLKDQIKGKIRMFSASVRKPDRQWRLDGFPGFK
ncbi:signal peptidase I [Ochrobactrum soli]|uniref:Signal peptidase I n=2 Tax=Ochrobactrum TaxID=528 RepID=A0ABD5JY33_9HYPH|nr:MULTISPECIES: signal peptidase I [Brucella]RRD28081.1 signal peptidase I [Brucellaceae bacterium VT-16-1752]WHT41064.1 signal peptidase I [Ochrobactrum sp. SSR]NNU58738.1 signal peptidase I [[Ochrobactrum] soli]RLL75384.1 signal peptidase I [[Ochrobactrum] soli]WHS32447.1 signal peptidase I [Brucella sp. NM4]